MKKGYFFINTNLFNGRAHSIQIIKTVEGLNQLGLEVKLVAPFFINKDFKYLSKIYNIKFNFNIVFLYNFGFKLISKMQIFLYCLVTVIYLFKLKFFKKIDFLYLRSELLFPLVLTARFLGIPYFFEVHNMKKNSNLKKYIIKKAQGVIVITYDLLQDIKDWQNNILLVDCGFDDGLFRYCESKKQKLNKKVVLGYAGGMSLSHGLDFIAENTKYFDNLQFHFIGGNEEDISRIRKKSYSNVHFFGNVPYNKVSDYLSSCDILLLPQLRLDQGAVSSKMYEYFALGKPIIATNTSGNKFRIKDNENGFLYEVNDQNDFREKVNLLISNKKLMEKFGRNNYQISKKFTFRERARKIFEFISSNL